jgi:hypothetical protein
MPDLATALTLLADAQEAESDAAAARRSRSAAELILDGMPPADAGQVRAWIAREAATPPAGPRAADPRPSANC